MGNEGFRSGVSARDVFPGDFDGFSGEDESSRLIGDRLRVERCVDDNRRRLEEEEAAESSSFGVDARAKLDEKEKTSEADVSVGSSFTGLIDARRRLDGCCFRVANASFVVFDVEAPS